LALAVASTFVQLNTPPTFPVQYATELRGQQVIVSIDGRNPHATFAGKLGFRDRQNVNAIAVCCDVRSPIRAKQAYMVQVLGTSKFGGNVTMAGNIVAKYFNSATSPDQCAGLQLAIWEAIEDGGAQADFSSGRFQALGNDNVMQHAAGYYQAVADPGNAVLLRTTTNNGQSQMMPWPNLGAPVVR
jgi:hypothetical protein